MLSRRYGARALSRFNVFAGSGCGECSACSGSAEQAIFPFSRDAKLLPCLDINRPERTGLVLYIPESWTALSLSTTHKSSLSGTRVKDGRILHSLSSPDLLPLSLTSTMSLTSAKSPPSYGSITKDDCFTLEDSAPKAEFRDFSDGGLAAWLTVLGAFLALFCSFGQMNAFGTFQSWYTTHQLHDLQPSTVAWIGSVQLWVFFFSVSTSFRSASHACSRLPLIRFTFAFQGGFIGRVFDVYGPRIIMALGTAIYVLSIILTSVARNYCDYLIAQGVLSGLGVGML